MESNFIEASKLLHQANPNYGKASEYENKNSMKYALTLPRAVSHSNKYFGSTSFLDHGTGKGGLVQSLRKHIKDNFTIDGYDPASKNTPHAIKNTTLFRLLMFLNTLELAKLIPSFMKSSIIERFFFFASTYCQLPKPKTTGMLISSQPPDWWIQKSNINLELLRQLKSARPMMEADTPCTTWLRDKLNEQLC